MMKNWILKRDSLSEQATQAPRASGLADFFSKHWYFSKAMRERRKILHTCSTLILYARASSKDGLHSKAGELYSEAGKMRNMLHEKFGKSRDLRAAKRLSGKSDREFRKLDLMAEF